MSQITATFPVYTGGDLLRTSNQAEFDAAMSYFFQYHKEQFQVVVNAFTSQANALRDEVNALKDTTLTYNQQANTYRSQAETEANKSLTYKNGSETAYNNTITLIENADITGTAGYTIAAVDDLMSRTRNLQFVGLN
jgi:PDZ domain-containing secreted protein